jgi:hypothetical protein
MNALMRMMAREHFAAAAMLAMIPLALDELVAMVQLVARRRDDESARLVFWLGANLDHTEPVEPHRTDTWRPRGMTWG